MSITEDELYDDSFETKTEEPSEDETPSNHYVKNKELYAALVEYKQEYLEAQEKGLPKPKPNDYIGKCIILIAEGLSHRFNFINYSYRDEMYLDGIENVISGLHNFNPKYKNAYGYINKILWWAFVRRINKEKHQKKIKDEMIRRTCTGEFEEFETQSDDDSHYNNSVLDYYSENQDGDYS